MQVMGKSSFRLIKLVKASLGSNPEYTMIFCDNCINYIIDHAARILVIVQVNFLLTCFYIFADKARCSYPKIAFVVFVKSIGTLVLRFHTNYCKWQNNFIRGMYSIKLAG